MKLTSPAFGDGQAIPAKYTCDGQNISPPLEIRDVPESTASLTLKVDDPDSPNGQFLHWIIVEISPTTTIIKEGTEPDGKPGKNDFGNPGWGGPCPVHGNHRYVFKLTAYDETGDELESTQLIGTYQRADDR